MMQPLDPLNLYRSCLEGLEGTFGQGGISETQHIMQ